MASEDDIKTQLLTRVKWLPPVDTLDELPQDGVAEGTRCFVGPEDADVEEVREFRGGRWVIVDFF